MLDSRVSKKNLFLNISLVLFVWGSFLGWRTSFLEVGEFSEKVIAKMAIGGTAKSPDIIFVLPKKLIDCKVYRCLYPEWKSDEGKAAEISIDISGRVIGIKIDDSIRLKSEDIRKRWMNYFVGASFLLISSGVFLIFGIKSYIANYKKTGEENGN